MFTKWENLLDNLISVKNNDYRDDPERMEARIENLEFVVMTMLEKLRAQKIAEDLP